MTQTQDYARAVETLASEMKAARSVLVGLYGQTSRLFPEENKALGDLLASHTAQAEEIERHRASLIEARCNVAASMAMTRVYRMALSNLFTYPASLSAQGDASTLLAEPVDEVLPNELSARAQVSTLSAKLVEREQEIDRLRAYSGNYKDEVRRVIDFTIADARLHNNIADLSDESVASILNMITALAACHREENDRARAAEAKLVESEAREGALTVEVEQLRLAICGGEDVPGYAMSLPLQTILDVQADNVTVSRSSFERLLTAGAEIEGLRAVLTEIADGRVGPEEAAHYHAHRKCVSAARAALTLKGRSE